MIKKFVRFPRNLAKKEINKFFINKNLKNLINLAAQKTLSVNKMVANKS